MLTVSVIVPNYNHAKYLEQRIDSILNQTYQDFELIIMDDCSTDDSNKIIESYRSHSKVSKIIHNEVNSGSTFKQWNKGIREAKGNYIWLAESDDYADPTFLETLVLRLQNDPELVLGYCQSYNINAEGQIIGTWKFHTDDLDRHQFDHDFLMSGTDYIKKFLIHKNTLPNASAIVFKKEKYWEVGGADESIKVSSDWRVWLKLLTTGNLVFIRQELNYYRTHENTVRSTTIQKGAHILEHLQMTEFIFSNVNNIDVNARKLLINNAAELVKGWMKTTESTSDTSRLAIVESLLRIDKNLVGLTERKKNMNSNRLTRALKVLQKQGFTSFIKLVILRIFPKQTIPYSPVTHYKTYFRFLKGKDGLEIGGPSPIFEKGDILPIYPIVRKLDGCNFSSNTIWEGEIQSGFNYKYNKLKKTGYQYICDASNLAPISSDKYDFILSSHSIEHIANPFKAISEWLRVLKKNGILLMVIPHKDGTFDHKRLVTKFPHLLNDFESQTQEDDLTHLPEILELHDLALDTLAGTKDEFHRRSLLNYENRCLHHHVFNTPLAIEIFTHFNIQIEALDLVSPMHIIIMGRKAKKVNNFPFLQYVNKTSPFPSDKQ